MQAIGIVAQQQQQVYLQAVLQARLQLQQQHAQQQQMVHTAQMAQAQQAAAQVEQQVWFPSKNVFFECTSNVMVVVEFCEVLTPVCHSG